MNPGRVGVLPWITGSALIAAGILAVVLGRPDGRAARAAPSLPADRYLSDATPVSTGPPGYSAGEVAGRWGLGPRQALGRLELELALELVDGPDTALWSFDGDGRYELRRAGGTAASLEVGGWSCDGRLLRLVPERREEVDGSGVRVERRPPPRDYHLSRVEVARPDDPARTNAALLLESPGTGQAVVLQRVE